MVDTCRVFAWGSAVESKPMCVTAPLCKTAFTACSGFMSSDAFETGFCYHKLGLFSSKCYFVLVFSGITSRLKFLAKIN